MSRSEREWRVEPDALVTRGGSGRERRYAWRDVVSVRLCNEPDRSKAWRYVFEIQSRRGEKIAIDNAHYLGGRSFEDRSDTYTAFVRAAVERIAAESPDARALIGETPKRYFFLLLGALVVLGAAAYALVALPTPIDNLPYASLVKFGVILLMLPIIWRVLGAMPRGVAMSEIPPRALPPEGSDPAG